MVINDRFAYVHMPKTGGTFITHVLSQVAGAESRRSMRHRPLFATRAVLNSNRLIVGSVRHPDTWYESRFGYAQQRPHGKFPLNDPMLMSEPVEAVIVNLTDPEYLAAHAEAEWTRHNLPPFPVYEIMRDRRIGLFTFEFAVTYARNPAALFARPGPFRFDDDDYRVDRWVKTEAMEGDLQALLGDLGAAARVPVEGEKAPRNARPVSERKPLSPLVRARIAEWDAEIIRRFYPS